MSCSEGRLSIQGRGQLIEFRPSLVAKNFLEQAMIEFPADRIVR